QCCFERRSSEEDAGPCGRKCRFMACPPDQSIRSSDARSPDSHRTDLDTEKQPSQSCRQPIGTTTPTNATRGGQPAADPSRFTSEQLHDGAVLWVAGGTAVAGCRARIRPKRVSQQTVSGS